MAYLSHQLNFSRRQVLINFLIFPTSILRTANTRTYRNLRKEDSRNTALLQIWLDPVTAKTLSWSMAYISSEIFVETATAQAMSLTKPKSHRRWFQDLRVSVLWWPSIAAAQIKNFFWQIHLFLIFSRWYIGVYDKLIEPIHSAIKRWDSTTSQLGVETPFIPNTRRWISDTAAWSMVPPLCLANFFCLTSQVRDEPVTN